MIPKEDANAGFFVGFEGFERRDKLRCRCGIERVTGVRAAQDHRRNRTVLFYRDRHGSLRASSRSTHL